MNISSLPSLKNPERDKTRLRVIFGCLSGLVLALTAWGIDAYTLKQAHSYLPWIKFALGALVAIPLYGLAGYAISRLGAKYLATFICFGISAYIISWLAAHLSFDLYNKMLGWVNPGLAARIQFVYDETAQTSFGLTAVILIVMAAVLSVFYELLIVQAYTATSKANIVFALIVILIFFSAGGLLLDYFDNQAQRPPIIQTALYISRAQSIQTGKLTYDSNLMSRERVFLDLETDLNREYKLVRVSYDPVLKFTNIYLLFDNEWYDCVVSVDQPFYCNTMTPVR
jgi:hypothetical protein